MNANEGSIEALFSSYLNDNQELLRFSNYLLILFYLIHKIWLFSSESFNPWRLMFLVCFNCSDEWNQNFE